MRMRYREIKPNLSLSRFVECFWTLENDAGGGQLEPERILPDGCVEIILNFGTEFRELLDDGHAVTQPKYFLVGQMTRPMFIAANGRVEMIGVRFHPGGTVPFFEVPMSELTNHVVELTALCRDLAHEVITRVGECRTLAEKLVELQTLLTRKVRDKHRSRVLGMAEKIVAQNGLMTIDQLAVDAGISSRQLERGFLREVGVSPKLLCRIVRFQQVFRALDQGGATWAEVAADCGYYDQAHLIRDFQQFARQAPSVLLAKASPLTQSFTRKDRMSDFYKTSASEVY
jgi:AraC-like DNA-binding protein